MNKQFGCTSIEWSRDMNLKLIEELKKRKSLWDQNFPEYKDKVKRSMDYQEIADIFSLPCPEMVKKIHNLKSQFRREYRRSKGKATSQWYGFRLLRFLKEGDKNKVPKLSKKYELWNSAQDMNPESSSTDIPSSTVPASPNKASASLEKQLDKRDTFKKSKDRFYTKKTKRVYKLDRDEHLVFGDYVAYELRKITNPFVLAVAKHKIQECLFEAQMSMFSSMCDFNENGDRYLPYSSQNPEDGQNTSSAYSSCSNVSATASPPPLELNIL